MRADIIVPRLEGDTLRAVERLTPAKRRATLAHHACIAALRGDVPSLRRAIVMAGASRSLDEFERDVIELIDDSLSSQPSGCPFIRAVLDDAISFLSSGIERVRLDIEQFEFEESEIPAVTTQTARLSPDRRRGNLSRIAFRALRTGTSRSRLSSHLAEANSTFASPLSAADLQKLTDWCIARHLEDISAKREGQTHAA